MHVDGEEQQLGADERADDDPDAQVHHPLLIEGARARAHQREPQPEQVGDGEQDAVGVDGEATDIKQDGMHGGGRGRSSRAAREWRRS